MTEGEAREAAHALVPLAQVPLSASELESYLGSAADMLRGLVDQADFKAFIFPLMFFKRISDVYLEEYTAALAASGEDHEFAAFVENHRFVIPDGCLWDDVRARTSNVGQALVTAFRGIEKANPDALYGIFGNAPWTNKQQLPDAKLLTLIEHFSSRSLASSVVPPDVFGAAYEYLIKRFADQSNKKAGEYYTPRPVVALMVNILDPKESEYVYDPACGTGGMLIEVIEHVKAAGGRPQLLWGKLYGQEKVLTTSGIARMNLLLHGVEDFEVIRGDTLRDPAFYDRDRLARFDCVIANPPFSLKKWGEVEWSSDPWGRNKLGGVPPASYADWAWVQHMVTSADPVTGRVAVVLPQGALFRGGKEKAIREHILKSDLIEAVIGLAPNLFYGTGLAACIMVLRCRKPAERRDKVLMVNAETLFRKGRNQNTLEPEHAAAILDAYIAFADDPGFAHVADTAEITANDYNLNIPLYVAPKQGSEKLTLEQALANLADARLQAQATRAALETELAKWGL
ncbi:MAG: type I restriction-modification system subunit M [Propionibacteriaceae bacterium]|nr:type I restriction-modification system subunit M [Propionibacteriaceae bacterium]